MDFLNHLPNQFCSCQNTVAIVRFVQSSTVIGVDHPETPQAHGGDQGQNAKQRSTTMLDHERLELADGVNYQSLGSDEDAVVLSMQSGFLYRCNPAAARVLESARVRPTFAALRDEFADHFSLDPTTATTDLRVFVKQLLSEKLLVKAA